MHLYKKGNMGKVAGCIEGVQTQACIHINTRYD